MVGGTEYSPVPAAVPISSPATTVAVHVAAEPLTNVPPEITQETGLAYPDAPPKDFVLTAPPALFKYQFNPAASGKEYVELALGLKLIEFSPSTAGSKKFT